MNGLGSPRHLRALGEPRPETYDSEREDRAILSFSLLLAVLVAGVVLSLTRAEANHSLLSILN